MAFTSTQHTMIARPTKSARMGNRKPAGRGKGCSPLEYIQRQRTKRGYVLDPRTGLRVYA